jgi:hypothetical protein
MEVEFIEGLPLEETMIFEGEHSIQLSKDQKQELKNAGAIFLYLRDAETKELVSETYYIKVDDMEKLSRDLQAEGSEEWKGKNAVYCYSNTTLTRYQRQGFGGMLKDYFLKQAKDKGYDFVIGHARRNGSIKLNLSSGAIIIREYPNWDGSETYDFYYRNL